MLSESDLSRIAAAVKTAEARTSGEVFCLVAEEVSDYREVPLAWGALAALILPPLIAASGLLERLLGVWAGWSASQRLAEHAAIARALSGYGLVQALIFAAVFGLVSIPAVRRALTPGFLKTQRVKRLAEQLFVATGMRDDPARTGVLIFAAFAERRVEVLADAAIHAKAGAGAWDEAVRWVVDGMRADRCAEGFETAIALCGDALAAAFPGRGGDADRLSDRPVQV